MSQSDRLHLVFVPGFGGFDVLGQLEYYAGTTELLARWCERASSKWGERVVLHYFDNLPTAGVCTRASLLKRFLAKRMLRGEIQRGDRIALIGHSTGGLDIRQLLLDLDALGAEPVELDGVEGAMVERNGESERAEAMTGARLLAHIGCVVFLSVPQRGTNIANWTRASSVLRDFAIGLARVTVDWLDAPVVQPLDVGLAWLLDRLRRHVLPSSFEEHFVPDLLLALQDVHAELAARVSRNSLRAAEGRAALGELNQWLSHSHGDFLAIDDLSCTEPPPNGLKFALASGKQAVSRAWAALSWRGGRDENRVSGVARRSDRERAEEREMWERRGIQVRSYATVAPCPFSEPRDGSELRSVSRVLIDALQPLPRTDFTYQLAYSACSAGPFSNAQKENVATTFVDRRQRRLAAWENDGIVNTASMLWPNGEQTLLVDGDHADVIGHFQRYPAPPFLEHGAGADAPPSDERKYHRYDILQSNCGFNAERFAALWLDIFEFCANAAPRIAAAERPAAE